MVIYGAAARTVVRHGRARQRFLSIRATSSYAVRRQQHFLRSIATVTAIGSAAFLYQWYTGENPIIKDVHAEAPPQQQQQEEQVERPTPVEVSVEERKKIGGTKEEIRNQISSQHLQVKKSWENPGVWCWGVNDGKVAAPDADQSIIKNPRWLAFFDGKLLRDLKLTRQFGAAITEKGDLLQWGLAYNPDEKDPVVTLKGKNLISLALSKDRVLALSADGTVYSMSASQEEQLLGPKPLESSWIPFWSTRSAISYRTLNPQNLRWTEKVRSISGGLEHVLLLTSKGRVYSAASGSEDFPSRGQLGVPGLTWFTKPSGSYDQPHEIHALDGFKIKQIAAGDNHSMALDRDGRVFGWGENNRGQLGIGETSKETPFFDTPMLLPMNKLYAGTRQKPVATSVSAGGNTTFLTVDATQVTLPESEADKPGARRLLGRVTADTWACGHGIWGQLGNGRWTHVQAMPTKILPLSGLFEYDEKKRRAVPIRMRGISVGSNHCAAIMDNVTYLDANRSDNENDTNWGADVLFFGNNEFYQLGTGKRNNVVVPTYIQPMDRRAEVLEGKRSKQEEHRFHVTPRATVRLGERWVNFEQRVVCGRGVTAVYSGV